jgi:hypothetical protein
MEEASVVTFLLGAGHGRRALVCLVVVGTVSTTMVGTHGAAAASQPRIADVAETKYGLAARRKPASTPLTRARAALATAKLRLTRRHYTKSLVSLKALRDNLGRAHRAGMAQIGKPPQDPESDEPPGPAAVMAVLNLEHRIMMELVPFLNSMKTSAVIESLRYTLLTTHRLRNAMLSRVIALPAEGAGGDYDDGMSDTLDLYTSEVTLITRALEQYMLTPAARVGLTNALARARATQKKVNMRWGGGE